jgi:hypothetical protein
MKIFQYVLAAVVLGNICGARSPTSAAILLNHNTTSRVSYQTARYYLDGGVHDTFTNQPFGTGANVPLGATDVTTLAVCPDPYSDLYASLRGIYTSHGETSGSFKLSFEQQELGEDSGKGANGAYTDSRVFFRVTEEVPYLLSGSFGPQGDIVPIAHWVVRLSEVNISGGDKLFEQGEYVYQDINGIYAGLDLPLTLGELQEAETAYTGALEGSTSGLLRPGYNYTLFVETELDQGATAGFDMSLWTGNVTLQIGDAATTLNGDYNENCMVDAADYVVWRNNAGTVNLLPNDLIGGTIGQAHYDQWRANFGASLGTGSGSSLPSAEPSSAAVPEPATVILVFLAAGICVKRCRTTAFVS